MFGIARKRLSSCLERGNQFQAGAGFQIVSMSVDKLIYGKIYRDMKVRHAYRVALSIR